MEKSEKIRNSIDMEDLEKTRNTLKKQYIKVILFIIVCIFTFLTTFILVQFSAIFVFLIFPINILLFIYLIKLIISFYKLKPEFAKYSEYIKIYKNTMVSKALEAKFEDLVYNPKLGIPREIIEETNMMYMGDRYLSEDYISGKYKNIKFEQSDILIEEKHQTKDSNGEVKSIYIPLIRGRWMIFDFNKTFKTNIQISQKGFGFSKLNNSNLPRERKFKSISMESERFNKKFNIYAQNEHDAFYIITPSLMDKIERLADMNNGKLLFCFVNNKLHICLNNNKDSFELGNVFKSINEKEIINNISKDIEDITQFVDELNLDNDLFKNNM